MRENVINYNYFPNPPIFQLFDLLLSCFPLMFLSHRLGIETFTSSNINKRREIISAMTKAFLWDSQSRNITLLIVTWFSSPLACHIFSVTSFDILSSFNGPFCDFPLWLFYIWQHKWGFQGWIVFSHWSWKMDFQWKQWLKWERCENNFPNWICYFSVRCNFNERKL